MPSSSFAFTAGIIRSLSFSLAFAVAAFIAPFPERDPESTSSASVAAVTCAIDIPGPVSSSVARPSGNAITAISVTTRSTGRVDVIGSVHFLTIFGAPLAVCCIATITRLAPEARSMAPPMPGTILLGIIQLASRPL